MTQDANQPELSNEAPAASIADALARALSTAPAVPGSPSSPIEIAAFLAQHGIAPALAGRDPVEIFREMSQQLAAAINAHYSRENGKMGGRTKAWPGELVDFLGREVEGILGGPAKPSEREACLALATQHYDMHHPGVSPRQRRADIDKWDEKTRYEWRKYKAHRDQLRNVVPLGAALFGASK
jgi:hypothetical protein